MMHSNSQLLNQTKELKEKESTEIQEIKKLDLEEFALWLVEYLKADSPPYKRLLDRGERRRKKEKAKIWEEIVLERNKIVEERKK